MPSEIIIKLALARPILTLILSYISWKTLLFLLTIASPGPGYDTSTSLLVSYERSKNFQGQLARTDDQLSPVYLKLGRWDVIYFASTAARGHVFEQEWAFGLGHTGFLNILSKVFTSSTTQSFTSPIVMGILSSNISHLLSVIILYYCTTMLYPEATAKRSSIAFLAALLHILSPAGVFLTAPYAEPLFSLLTFGGCWMYIKATLSYDKGGSTLGNALTLLAGATFGMATSVRSNGLLNGLLFVLDALPILWSFLNRPAVSKLLRLVTLGLSFVFVLLGSIVPQLVAYDQYCLRGSSARLWCNQWIPSIYSWVQGHYWNSGFLRYWTVSNLPLFMLATPMMILLSTASVDIISRQLGRRKSNMNEDTSSRGDLRHTLMFRLAVPQLVLALTVLMTSHVQIITRLASGCPVWYIWVANQSSRTVGPAWDAKKWTAIVVRWMMIYALVQGGLYASFLPPA